MSIIEGTCWVVEYIGAVPVPVYATVRCIPTTEVRFAMTFGAKEAAEAWMARKHAPYVAPWTAVEYKFGAIKP